MATIYSFRHNGSTIIPTANASILCETMRGDHANCQFFIEFFSDAAGVIPVTPTGGTITVQGSPMGNNFVNGNAKPLRAIDCGTPISVYQPPYFTGAMVGARMVLNGITGAAFCRAWMVRDVAIDEIPAEVFTGSRAITVQPYTEANCKNGSQFEISSYVPVLAAGASIDTILLTGSLPVLIKSRNIGFNGSLITADIYKSPTYSGGTIVPYHNLNTWNPIAGIMQVISGATVSAVGAKTGATTYAIGNTSPGVNANASFGIYAAGGLERVLAPNTAYLFRTTNGGSTDTNLSVFATWFEGNPDLPL